MVPSFLGGPRTSIFYNNLYFNKIQIGLVRGPLSHPERSPFLVTIDGAARRSEGSGTEHCHPERLLVIMSVSEGSGVPHWSSTSAATGDAKGDMHPDDAVESIYRGATAHISTFLWRYAPR